MFDNIEELEKEIRDFRRNILASKELLGAMESLVATMKKQSTDVQTASNGVIAKLDAQALLLQSNSTATLQGLVAELDSSLADLRDLSSQTVAAIKTDSKTQNAETLTEIKNTHAEYTKKLAEATKNLCAVSEAYQTTNDSLIAGNQSVATQINQAAHEFIRATNAAVSRIETKEAELSKKIDAINYEQLLQICVDMKKSIETKMTILIAGVGFSILIGIISLLI